VASLIRARLCHYLSRTVVTQARDAAVPTSSWPLAEVASAS
jgi:hypothetical protein